MVPITMEGAENFFVKDPSVDSDQENLTTYFRDHIEDKVIISQNLYDGIFFKGTVKTNPKFRYRAFVSIDDLNIDVMVKGMQDMNRAIDGDKVLI